MVIFNDTQQALANRIHSESTISNWKDWKWQLKNTIRTIDQFTKLTGISFDEEEKKNAERNS